MPARKWHSREQIIGKVIDYVEAGGEIVPNRWKDKDGKALYAAISYYRDSHGNRFFSSFRDAYEAISKYLESIGEEGRAAIYDYKSVSKNYERKRRHPAGKGKVRQISIVDDYPADFATGILGLSQDDLLALAEKGKLVFVSNNGGQRVTGRSLANYIELGLGWMKPAKLAERHGMSEWTVRKTKIPMHPDACVRVNYGNGSHKYLIDPARVPDFAPERTLKKAKGYSIEYASQKTGVGKARIRRLIDEGILKPEKESGAFNLDDSDLNDIKRVAGRESAGVSELAKSLKRPRYKTSDLVRMGFPMSGLHLETTSGRIPVDSDGNGRLAYKRQDLLDYLERYNKAYYLSGLRGDAPEGYYTICDSTRHVGLSEQAIRNRIKIIAGFAPEKIVRLSGDGKVYTLVPEESIEMLKGDPWKPQIEDAGEMQYENVIPKEIEEKALKHIPLSREEERIVLSGLDLCRKAKKYTERKMGLRFSYLEELGHLVSSGKYSAFVGWEEIGPDEAAAFLEKHGRLAGEGEHLESLLLSANGNFIWGLANKYARNYGWRYKFNFFQAGCVGFAKAMKRFDLSKLEEARLLAHLKKPVIGEMERYMDEFGDENIISLYEERRGVTFMQRLEDTSIERPDIIVEKIYDTEVFLSKLGKRERILVEERFGLLDGNPKTLKEARALIGLSRRGAVSMERDSMEKMREMARKEEEYLSEKS